jgi:hypothetical protein
MEIECIVDYGYPYKQAYSVPFKRRTYPLSFHSFLFGLRRILNIAQQQAVRRIYFPNSRSYMNFQNGIYEPYWNLTHQDP